MVLFADMAAVVSENEPIGPHTLFGLGGAARWFARPRSVDQLQSLVGRCVDEGVSLDVLGLGANLLVRDEGVDGLVLRLSGPAFRDVHWPQRVDQADGEVRVRAGGGADMNKLARESVRRGLAGLEIMAGIPGTLGGIIRMNAGGRWGEIASAVRDVTVLDAAGSVRTLSREQVGFRYRRTSLGECIVCEATLALRPEDPARLRRRFLDFWAHKRQTQPLGESSAGCVFRNPPGGKAGELIDKAGLKGRTVGGAQISQVHANFIVAKEGATANDVLGLIGLVRREVAERFGVELELEIQIWGHRRARQGEPITR